MKIFRDDPDWLIQAFGIVAVLSPFLVYGCFGGDLKGY